VLFSILAFAWQFDGMGFHWQFVVFDIEMFLFTIYCGFVIIPQRFKGFADRLGVERICSWLVGSS
jgi:hypothetical protein